MSNIQTRNLLILSTVVSCIVFARCGAGDAIKATNSMPGKMTEMSEKMDTTNKTTGEMSQKMDTTNKQMAETLAEITKTADSVHRQTLKFGLEEMLKPENRGLVPSITGMIPGGKIFTLQARPEEIMGMIYLNLKAINKEAPADVDSLSDEQKVSIDREKTAKFNVIMVIAGLTPQAKVEAIVKSEIDGSGRYSKAAYAFLALRLGFISGVMLKGGLLSEPLTSLGEVNEAVESITQLDYIVRLPYTAKIEVTTIGMINSENNRAIKIKDTKMTIDMWKRVDRAFDQELDPQFRETDKAKELREKAKAALASWQAKG